MRVVERKILALLKERGRYIARNLSERDFVEKFTGGDCRVCLHGNEIFSRNSGGDVYFSQRGWNTPTTRSRLNALVGEFVDLPAKFFTRNYDCYLALGRETYPIYTREVYTIKGGKLYFLDGLDGIEVVPIPKKKSA